jgi:hypothetical protein
MREYCRLSEDPNLQIGVLEAGDDLSSDPLVKSAGAYPSPDPISLLTYYNLSFKGAGSPPLMIPLIAGALRHSRRNQPQGRR